MSLQYRMRKDIPPPGPHEDAALADAVSEVLDESRTVLPGIQAFIGFQLVAVFSVPFWERLEPYERTLHLGAIVLNVIALVFLLTPATYHRRRESGYHSEGFVNLASRLLSVSTIPLIVSVALDLYLIARLVFGSVAPALGLSLAVLVFALFWWQALPSVPALRDRLRR